MSITGINAAESTREHSRRRGVSFVVMPQLLLNGEEYRRGARYDDFENKIKAVNQSQAQADIRLKLSSSASTLVGFVDVSIARNLAPKRAQVYLVLYENNLVTAVGAGEIRGKTLKHDFVVRSLAGPLALDDDGKLSHAQRFELDRR